MTKEGNHSDGTAKDNELQNQLAEASSLIDSGDLPAAFKKLRTIKKRFGDQADICYLWGIYYFNKELYDKAIKWLKDAIWKDDKDPDKYLMLAEAFRCNKEPRMEIETLWRGADSSRDPLRFFLHLENTLVSYKDEAGSLKLIEEVKNRYKGKPELYYKQGEAAFAIGLSITALDHFRRCVAQDYVGSHQDHYIAQCFNNLGLHEYASRFYQYMVRDGNIFPKMLSDVINLVRWRMKSADEKLEAALSWKLAVLTDDLGIKMQSNYLDLSDECHEAVLKEWGELDERDRGEEIVMFCRFYRDLLWHRPKHRVIGFDPAQSLWECVGVLGELDMTQTASIFEGWLAGLKGDLNKGRSIFTYVMAEYSFWPEPDQTLLQEGLEYIEGKKAEDRKEVKGGSPEVLAKYGTKLTTQGKRSGIARSTRIEREALRIFDTILHSSSKSVVLVGPSGIGKTAAVQALAGLLNEKSCPRELKGFSIWQVSTASILSGTMYIGMWQQQLEEVCKAGSFDSKVILYLEDIANIFGAGVTTGDPSNFADYLIPRLESNQIVLIGELDQYQAQSLFWKHPRLERVVIKLTMEEPDQAGLLDILSDEADQLAKQKKTVFSTESVRETAALTGAFLPYMAYPGKAIDLLRRASGLFAGRSDKKEVKIAGADIVLAFCEQSGIPSFVVDSMELLDQSRVESFFGDRILGQRDAIVSVMNAVTCFKTRLCDSGKPIRNLLFVGPTGVGKTECAKVLAEYLFGDPDRMIRLNMSEFSDGLALSKLLGTSTGNVPRSGFFLDSVRKQPFSVVLLDEIEKADKDVLNLLLQLLDEGVLTGGDGKPTFFQSSVVIMTSNIGTRRYVEQTIGFGSEGNEGDIKDAVLSDVREFFSPEVFNRFDEVVCFRPLDHDALATIVNREIGKVLRRRGVVDKGISVDVDPLLRDYILELGFDPKYGARHLKRVVESHVAVPLAQLLASTSVSSDQLVRINLHAGKAVAVPIEILAAEKTGMPTARPGTELPKLDLGDKELTQLLSSTQNRIEGLKSLFEIEDTETTLDGLRDRMNSPTFWDKPAEASKAMKLFAELSRRSERVQRWEVNLERVSATLTKLGRRAPKAELARSRNLLTSLLKDLESAELELLLEGKYDSADAYVILQSQETSSENIKWMRDVAGMYASWTRRRGYRYHFFGESTGTSKQSAGIFLHISGLNSFGLLKNERGVHRKVGMRKAGSRLKGGKIGSSVNLDCTVIILADVQPLVDPPGNVALTVRKLKPARRGWKLRSLSRQVSVSDKVSGQAIDYLSDSKVDSDRQLPVEMFMSFLHFRKRTKGGIGTDVSDPWGSVVRTFEPGPPSRIVDHASGITIRNVRDYLTGKIDSLLLERLV